jgi:hypothetical protein
LPIWTMTNANNTCRDYPPMIRSQTSGACSNWRVHRSLPQTAVSSGQKRWIVESLPLQKAAPQIVDSNSPMPQSNRILTL